MMDVTIHVQLAKLASNIYMYVQFGLAYQMMYLYINCLPCPDDVLVYKLLTLPR